MTLATASNRFKEIMNADPDTSAAVAAITVLIEFLQGDNSETIAGLRTHLSEQINSIKATDSSVTSVTSACELFLRFITLTSLETNMSECRMRMIDRGKTFLDKVATSRGKIAKLFSPIVTDDCKILVHSRSRVVLKSLIEAANDNKNFHCYITESQPDRIGREMQKNLEAANIPCTLILDASVGYIMEIVDLVLVGAEGVVESGGIINKIGTYTVAVCAKELHKPVYVLAESFKFVRQYPLNQRDIPNQFKYTASTLQSNADLNKEHPQVDYTPPQYVTLLFTDLGILTPSAVSDELIKLYL